MKVYYENVMPLTRQNIDLFSESIQEITAEQKADRKKILQLRLLAETVLLDFMEHFGEEAEFTARVYRSFSGNYLSLTVRGEKFNPLKKQENRDDYFQLLLENVSVSSSWQYSAEDGNQVVFRIPKKRPGDLLLSVSAIALAFLLYGVMSLFPQEASSYLAENILAPVGSAYLSLVSTGGILMVFLSLVCAVSRMNSINRLKNTGGIVIRHLMLKNAGYGVLFAAVLPFLFHSISADAGSGGNAGSQIISILIGIIPSNIIDPFLQQNALQVSFMALILGIFLLINKHRAGHVIAFFEELNNVILSIVRFVCSFLPIYIFVAFSKLLLSGSIGSLADCWVIFAAAVLFCFIYVVSDKVIIGLKYRSSVPESFRNTVGIALVGFVSGSSIACLDANRTVCLNRFQLDRNNLEFSLVIQQILYKVDIIISFLCSLYGFSSMFGIQYSPAGYVVMTISAIMMAIVVPPVPGGSIAIMTSIFATAALPDEATTLFVSLFIFLNMFVTGSKVFCVSYELLAIDRKLKKNG